MLIQSIPESINLVAAIAPIGAFWVAFQNLWSAAKFVNEIRETIVTGRHGGADLSLEHRKALFFDWQLSMAGTILAALVFGSITFWLGDYIESNASEPISKIGTATQFVAAFPFLVAFCFGLCGASDIRLIRHALMRSIPAAGHRFEAKSNDTSSEPQTGLSQPDESRD